MSETILVQILDEIKSIKQEQVNMNKSADNRFNELNDKVDNIAGQVDLLAGRVDNLTGRVDDLTERVDNFSGQMDNLTERVDILTDQVNSLADEQGQIKRAVLETKDDVEQIMSDQKSFYEIIGEHEISIRSLRREERYSRMLD